MFSEHLTGRISRPWLMVALSVGLALAIALSIAFADDADAAKKRLRNFTQSDTVDQSGDLDYVEDVDVNDPDDPFTYSKVNKIRRITQVTITARLFDGDTGPKDGDEDDLTLTLDGIDTGIELNGFRDDETDTRARSGAPDNARQIVSELKEDGELQAGIADATPNDNNEVGVPANFDTTLMIKGKLKKKRR